MPFVRAAAAVFRGVGGAVARVAGPVTSAARDAAAFGVVATVQNRKERQRRRQLERGGR